MVSLDPGVDAVDLVSGSELHLFHRVSHSQERAGRHGAEVGRCVGEPGLFGDLAL